MGSIINTLGVAIIAGKYALFVILAGLTLTGGISAADSMLLVGIENNE